MVGLVRKPVLPVPSHLQTTKAPLIQFLTRSLQMLRSEIDVRDRQIRQAYEALPEAEIISSLPGAGPTLAPSLLACMGRDRQRYPTVAHAQGFMGTSPVTATSGKSRKVFFRRGCWKFARRTLQLYADQSRHQCAWAQEFYHEQRDSGHGHHAALRALAHKWVKIILAMLRSGTPYNDAVFINSRQRRLLRSKGRKIGTYPGCAGDFDRSA